MKPQDVLLRADEAIGDNAERLVRAHHRRRLRAIGWERALDPPPGVWCAGDPPPRPGSAIDVLIDGEEALPRIAEAILMDYVEHNRPPRMVVIEVTSSIVSGALASELQTYAGLSPRLAALYAEEHPVAAVAGRTFRLFPLNSGFFLEALHYMWQTDQDWIHRDAMPPALRTRPRNPWRLVPFADNVNALVRIVGLLHHRGIEVRLVIAPYGPSNVPVNVTAYAALITRRAQTPVWNYVGAVTDPDEFADQVHLNERGSRVFLRMLQRDGAFGMTSPPGSMTPFHSHPHGGSQ